MSTWWTFHGRTGSTRHMPRGQENVPRGRDTQTWSAAQRDSSLFLCWGPSLPPQYHTTSEGLPTLEVCGMECFWMDFLLVCDDEVVEEELERFSLWQHFPGR